MSDYLFEYVEKSDFIRNVLQVFADKKIIEEYFYHCHSAIYGSFRLHQVKESKFDDSYFSTVGVALSKEQYESSKRHFLLKDNPFYGLIYNAISRLDEAKRKTAAYELSTLKFFKMARNDGSLNAAFNEFFRIDHPVGDFWLTPTESERTFFEVMFYGAIAALILRYFEYEIRRIDKSDKDSPHIEDYVSTLLSDVNSLIDRMYRLSPFDSLNEINDGFIVDLKNYRDLLELEANHRVKIFGQERKNDAIRYMLADIVFCLRRKIDGKAVKFGPIKAAMEGLPSIVSRDGGSAFEVNASACREALKNAVKVSHLVAGLIKETETKKQYVEVDILEKMVDRLIRDSYHDFTIDKSGVFIRGIFLTRGVFCDPWRNEIKISISV